MNEKEIVPSSFSVSGFGALIKAGRRFGFHYYEFRRIILVHVV